MAYNSLHTALEAAVNGLLATGLCAEIDLVMSPNFSLEGNRIKAAEYRVVCTKPASSVQKMLVTFEPPREREDGAMLNIEEIVGYELVFDGECVYGRTITSDGLKSREAVSCGEVVE